MFQTQNNVLHIRDFAINISILIKKNPELSRCVISWLEESCTPYVLQEIMVNTLDQVKAETQRGNQAVTRESNHVPNAE